MLRAVTAITWMLVLLVSGAAAAENAIVRMATPMGDIDLEVCEEISTRCTHAAPNTAANFLSYVDDGLYHDSFIHRSVNQFILQGGSFGANHVNVAGVFAVPSLGLIESEYSGFSNVRGTVSVPLASDPPTSQDPCATNPNSGSSGWFINLGATNQNLDCGSFTVFAVVTDEASLAVADEINTQLFKINFGYGPSPVTPEYVCPNPQACTVDPTPYLIYTEPARVPEPGTGLAAAVALGALAVLKRRRA